MDVSGLWQRWLPCRMFVKHSHIKKKKQSFVIYTLKQKSKTWVHKFGFMETDSYCRFHQFLFIIHGLQCWKTTTSAFSVLSIYTLLCAMQRNWLFPQTDGRLVKKFPKVRGAFVFLRENSRSLIIWHRKLSKTIFQHIAYIFLYANDLILKFALLHCSLFFKE